MLVLVNHPSGLSRVAPTGFSWTTLFFGFFPSLFRGDVKWALVQIGCMFLSGGISLFIFPFIYNKLYLNDLIANGWQIGTYNSVPQYGQQTINVHVNSHKSDS